MSKLLQTVLFISLFFFSVSCKKERQDSPEGEKQYLSIVLDNTYMPATKIDSVIVTWEINGSRQRARMQLIGNRLEAPLSSFTEGTGKFSIELYSNLKFVYYSSLWLHERELNLKHTEAVRLSAPSNFNDQHWTPRVLMRNATMKINAVVGLRPSDPYFLVKEAEKNYRKVLISRDYWKTKQGLLKAGGGIWECTSNCLTENGDILNTDFFKLLPAQLNSHPWDHIEIVIFYQMDAVGGGYSLDMNYTLPDE